MTQHTEAPSSINFKGKTSIGWEVMVTLRDDSEANLLERFRLFAGILLENGIEPTGKTNGTSPNGAPPAFTAPTTDTNEQLSFKADELVGSTNNGKIYWRVKGTPFTQYGVVIWNEILDEAGFNSEALDPQQTYDLTGYTATYVRNEKGNPKKVVRLIK